MERAFNVWTFKGLYTSCNIKEMSLKECFEKYGVERFNTKEFFTSYRFAFICNVYSTEELTAEIEKGLSLFPISEKQNMREVKRYTEIGLDPVFIRVSDLREFRKIYGK